MFTSRVVHWEKERIAEYYKEHGSAGYRAVTYRMIDEDVVAVTPRTVYRVLKSGGFFARSNDKKRSTKGQGFTQPLKPHEHRHVDSTYLNICGTFHYFMAVLDGCSRYIGVARGCKAGRRWIHRGIQYQAAARLDL